MLQVAINAIVTADKQRELDAATPAVAKKQANVAIPGVVKLDTQNKTAQYQILLLEIELTN
jgi:hypothetical protein